MNVKRFIAAAIALFIFVFFYEWFVHGYLLTDLYQASAGAWRPMHEMMANMPLGILIEFVFSAWLAFVFTRLFKNGGWKKGALFGLYFGVFAGILSAGWYVWLPIAATLAWSWFISSIIEGIIGGIILGAIYKQGK